MFDDYAKKLEELGADVPKIFERVAKKGAIKFREEAIKKTDLEGLVDTGNYKRNWNGKAIRLDENTVGIVGSNNVEYASHLEYGHRMRNGKIWKGKFVGDRALQEINYFCIKQLDNEWQKALKKN